MAVDDVTFTIEPGQTLCLVGESGCGKSTTGRMTAGLLEPSQGRVLYGETEVGALPDAEKRRFRRAVQIIHQDPYASLNPIRNVTQILSAPLRRHKLTKSRSELVSRAHRCNVPRAYGRTRSHPEARQGACASLYAGPDLGATRSRPRTDAPQREATPAQPRHPEPVGPACGLSFPSSLPDVRGRALRHGPTRGGCRRPRRTPGSLLRRSQGARPGGSYTREQQGGRRTEDGVIPELGRAGFRIGFLIVVPSFILIFFLKPGTAEYAITLLTLVMGVVFLVAVTLLVLYSRR